MHLLCPHCNQILSLKGSSRVCAMGHSFDIAKSGYVNLLPSNKKKSAAPGDNKDMIKARVRVMQSGYYNALLAVLRSLLEEYKPNTLLDMGCGEGSLTCALSSYAKQTIGVDISKEAVEIAAKRGGALYAVASAAALPIEDHSVDLLLNCFAPLYEESALRVLTPKGILIKVTPAPEHLFELKQAIYPSPYLNPPDKPVNGFTLISAQEVRNTLTLEGDRLLDVLSMTPYFYKTPKEYLEKVRDNRITTTLCFSVRVLTPAR